MDLKTLSFWLWASIIVAGLDIVTSTMTMMMVILRRAPTNLTPTKYFCVYFTMNAAMKIGISLSLFLAANVTNDAVATYMRSRNRKPGHIIPRRRLDTWNFRKILFYVVFVYACIVNIAITSLLLERVQSGELGRSIVVTETSMFLSMILSGLAVYHYPHKISQLIDPATMANTVCYSDEEGDAEEESHDAHRHDAEEESHDAHRHDAEEEAHDAHRHDAEEEDGAKKESHDAHRYDAAEEDGSKKESHNAHRHNEGNVRARGTNAASPSGTGRSKQKKKKSSRHPFH